MDPRYPIGPFVMPATTTADHRAQWIKEIAATPAALRAAVAGLSDTQLDTPYREGGWIVRQVVHHLCDSHIHAWVRMKSALIEVRPAVRAYDEVRYAELADYRLAPVETSLDLLEALHARLVVLLRSLTEIDLARVYVHSADGPVRLDQQLANYAWHGLHHVAHITELRKRMGW